MDYDIFAPYYDSLERGIEGDEEFYRTISIDHKEILEIGAGTGRITKKIVRHGIRVTALDNSGKMLALLQERTKKHSAYVTAIQADMRDFNLHKTFTAIIIPFRALQHLYTKEDQLRALTTIKEHLSPNGRLFFDVFNSNSFYLDHTDNQWHTDSSVPFPSKYKSVYNANSQILTHEMVFTPGNEEVILQAQLYCYTKPDIEALIHETSLKIVNCWGNFYNQPFQETSSEIVIEASL